MAIEYTVRPVVRYFVTRWEDGAASGSAWNTGSSFMGVFDNVEQANRVADAMSRVDPEPSAVAKLLGEDSVASLQAAATAVCRAQIEG